MSVLYDLEWQRADGTPVGSASGVTTVDYRDISGLLPGVAYRWRVRADDAGEKSDWSDWSSFQTTGVSVFVPSTGAWLSASVPAVHTGASVSATAVPLTLGKGTPTILTGASVSATAVPLTLGKGTPTILTGASVSMDAVALLLDAPPPRILTGVSLTVPALSWVLAAHNMRFVGQMPDGVDRPRAVSVTPKRRVSHV